MHTVFLPDLHVCYYVFSFRRFLFADERDKKRFLDFVLPRISAPDRVIVAFVLLDEEFHFVAVSSSARKGQEEAGQVMGAVRLGLRHVSGHCETENAAGEGAEEDLRGMRQMLLFGTCQVIGTCRFIHRLPILRGYTCCLRNYWWSSMQTYLGVYLWKGVQSQPIAALCCADDAREGIRRFVSLHKGRLSDSHRNHPVERQIVRENAEQTVCM